jgi:SAM-dependent methyltransferase
MRLAGCGSCGSTDLDPILDLGSSPLADEFPTHPDPDARRWPLDLLRCRPCTLVQLGEVVPDDILWQGDYGFYTGSSPDTVTQQGVYAQELMVRHRRSCETGVVEIACNDGTMLQHFARAGYRTLGVDPAKGPAAAARSAGLEVWVEPFTTAAAARILNQRGPAGLVIANHVLAHVADLNDFLHGLWLILDPDGVAVVEFQYLADLLLGNQFDHVYHEHRRFFSLTALQTVLARHRLQVVDVEQIPRENGSLRCTIQYLTDRHIPQPPVGYLLEQERWLADPAAVAGLQGRADRIRNQLRQLLAVFHTGGLRVAGYGASAKATTLLNWCDVGADLVQYMVDTTPTKHGRYVPGTAIPIISPTADSRAPDVYLLTVHNYLPGVLRREAAFTGRGGRWLVPIPQPVVL